MPLKFCKCETIQNERLLREVEHSKAVKVAVDNLSIALHNETISFATLVALRTLVDLVE